LCSKPGLLTLSRFAPRNASLEHALEHSSEEVLCGERGWWGVSGETSWNEH
jgi:hypothetical protein